MPDDAVRAVAELAASQHRAFTRRQAAEKKFDRARVATAKRVGWLEEPYPGVLVIVGSEADWHQLLMAATLAEGGHAVASHRAAARLHGLDGFAECDDVEVSVTARHRWRRGGVTAHHVNALDALDVVTVSGIRCTGLARTLADLGAVAQPLEVRRALTDARRRGTSLRWIQLTAERLHRPGPSGTAVLLRQLATIPFEGRLPDSWFEELLALCLDDPDIPELVPQYPILDDTGRVVAKTDIGIPSVRLGLEGHSRRFHFGPTPSHSTSSATWPRRRAVGSCSTSAGTRRGDRPTSWQSSSRSSLPGAANSDRSEVTSPRSGQSSSLSSGSARA